jgi:hypothetical protein
MSDIKLTAFIDNNTLRTMEVTNGATMVVCLDKWAEGARAFRIDAPEPESAPVPDGDEWCVQPHALGYEVYRVGGETVGIFASRSDAEWCANTRNTASVDR